MTFCKFISVSISGHLRSSVYTAFLPKSCGTGIYLPILIPKLSEVIYLTVLQCILPVSFFSMFFELCHI